MLKIVYTIFIGVLLLALVATGVQAFYPEPVQPRTPDVSVDSPDFAKYDALQTQYDRDRSLYDRNVSIIMLALAVVLLLAGWLLGTRLPVITDGFLVGGVLTLLYSISKSINSQDNLYRFVSIAVCLGVVLFFGYRKFAGAQAAPTGKKRS